MKITMVPGSHKHRIHIQDLLLLFHIRHNRQIQRALIPNMQAYTICNYRGAFDVDDISVGQDVVRPCGFCYSVVAIADALRVEGLVDVLQEADANDAVVGVAVLDYGGAAEGGGSGEGAVYACGVKEFVDARGKLTDWCS
jgi:hypothetical protein